MLATLLSLLARGGGAGPLVQALVHAQQRPYLTMASRAAQPPALHGPVHKVGPINMTLFYPPVAHPCKVERLRWYVAAAAAADNETAAPAAELRHGPCLACQVFAVRPHGGVRSGSTGGALCSAHAPVGVLHMLAAAWPSSSHEWAG